MLPDRDTAGQTGGSPFIHLAAVTKSYQTGRRSIAALQDVDLDISAGEWLAILGPSGCGKSTLLNLLSGIDRPTSGTVEIDGLDLSRMSEDQLARWRRQAVGIVFQFFQLMPTLTAIENVRLPMDLSGRHSQRDRAVRLLQQVGLDGLADHLPNELSGGEQQRVAIARALANEPALILADEPTGNLDSAAGQRVLGLLAEMWRAGKTIILVTHDHNVADYASRVIEMRDGRIVSDRRGTEHPTPTTDLLRAAG